MIHLSFWYHWLLGTARWTNTSEFSSKSLLKPAHSRQTLSYPGNSEVKKWCTCTAPIHLIHCRKEQTCQFVLGKCLRNIPAATCPCLETPLVHLKSPVQHNRAMIPETSGCSRDTNKGKKRSNAFDCIANLIIGLLNYPMHICSLKSQCEILQRGGNCTAKAFVIQDCPHPLPQPI